jgi:hypothetical protein
VEFAYNNSSQASIRMAPYEALYGRKCAPLCWDAVGEKAVLTRLGSTSHMESSRDYATYVGSTNQAKELC